MKHGLTICSSNYVFRYLSILKLKFYIHTIICKSMFIVDLFITTKSETTRIFLNRWINSVYPCEMIFLSNEYTWASYPQNRCIRTLNAHCLVKEGSLKQSEDSIEHSILYRAWFQLYDIMEKAKLLLQ